MSLTERKTDSNGKKTNLTFEQGQALLALYRYGFTAQEVAGFFKLSTTAVYYKYKQFKAANITPDRRITIEEALDKEGFNI